MEPSITQRIIRGNKRVGMMMAFKMEDDVKLGFSLCSKQDKYNHALAKKICFARASSVKPVDVPPSIIGDLEAFACRCTRYFKDMDLQGE